MHSTTGTITAPMTRDHEVNETNMTTTATESPLVGLWRAQLTFTKGPREGGREPVTLTFLADGVIVHADDIRVEKDQLPRGIGEWTTDGDSFSYWFNVVLNDPGGRPTIVVYVHGDGTLAPDGRTFTASGGSEVHGSTGELLATNRVDLHATRAEDRTTERSPGLSGPGSRRSSGPPAQAAQAGAVCAVV